MSDYDNTNRGVFFQNEKTSENSPDYTGKINIDGVEKRIAGWKKMSQGGKPFLSIAVSDPQPPIEQTAQQAQQPLNSGGLDDEIPF
jgi:uncharacterized protein (DUF736 family)